MCILFESAPVMRLDAKARERIGAVAGTIAFQLRWMLLADTLLKSHVLYLSKYVVEK